MRERKFKGRAALDAEVADLSYKLLPLRQTCISDKNLPPITHKGHGSQTKYILHIAYILSIRYTLNTHTPGRTATIVQEFSKAERQMKRYSHNVPAQSFFLVQVCVCAFWLMPLDITFFECVGVFLYASVNECVW